MKVIVVQLAMLMQPLIVAARFQVCGRSSTLSFLIVWMSFCVIGPERKSPLRRIMATTVCMNMNCAFISIARSKTNATLRKSRASPSQITLLMMGSVGKRCRLYLSEYLALSMTKSSTSTVPSVSMLCTLCPMKNILSASRRPVHTGRLMMRVARASIVA